MAPSFYFRPATIFASKPSSSYTLLFLAILFIIGLYTLHHHHHDTAGTPGNALHFGDLFLSAASNYTISSYLRRLTRHPHVAGTEAAVQTAMYVENHFRDLGMNTFVKHYNALLSYPAHASLSAHFSNGTVKAAVLAEPGSAGNDVIPPYHAYSPSGAAYGKAVFVNYGMEEDYGALAAQGVSVAGCVVVARRGLAPRNAVVEKAAENGAAAVLMYSETEGFGDGVERGTVMAGLGDPLSPGWAGVDGGEILGLNDKEVVRRFPKIPSMPVSADTAETILSTLEGPRAPSEWKARALRVGPGPTMLNFSYQGVKKLATLRNVFAMIRGSEEPDRFVLLGNHRDAWTYGAVDPNSGTAALLDIARRYALLMHSGWNPRRSIVLCSWDAEEFGMIGSTEWVEQNLLNLGSKAVAYLNVDCAVQGPGFFAGATPQLDDLLVEVTKKVKDPDSDDMTLYKKWTTTSNGINIQRLSGVDSDFAPFLQHAGVPSIDLYYGRDFPVYHTAFDDFSWMIKYGDPLFQRHVAVTGVWGLLALRLADDAVLPFNYLSYAAELQEYANILSNLLGGNVFLRPILAAIQELRDAGKKAEDEAMVRYRIKISFALAKWRYLPAPKSLIFFFYIVFAFGFFAPYLFSYYQKETVYIFSYLTEPLYYVNLKKMRVLETAGNLMLKQRALNDRLMFAERGFLDAEGLQGRQWFKHLVYGPRRHHESKLVFFPGLVDAVSQFRQTNKNEGQAAMQHEIWRVARAIQRAAYTLRGEFA